MSEKRIYCVEVSGDCRYFGEVKESELCLCETGCYCCENGDGWERITKDKCKNCTKAKYQGITREQAIKQMTDAIFKEIAPCLKPFYKVPKGKRGCVKVAAEAALNALLEANACK